MIDYNIIATGSSGNAVRIANVMIDCGIPYKKMKPDLYKCDALLITHIHSDHVKSSTLYKIRQEFPNIQVFGNWEVAERWPVDKIIGEKPFVIKRGNVQVTPVYGKHDTTVNYFALDFDGFKVFYATDTAEVHNPTDDKFDAIFLEANYDEKILKQLAKNYASGRYDPYESVYRHLSVKTCKEFYFSNRRTPGSPLIELHQSARFR